MDDDVTGGHFSRSLPQATLLQRGKNRGNEKRINKHVGQRQLHSRPGTGSPGQLTLRSGFVTKRPDDLKPATRPLLDFILSLSFKRNYT